MILFSCTRIVKSQSIHSYFSSGKFCFIFRGEKVPILYGAFSNIELCKQGTRVSSRKDELKPSMQDLASRASSLALANSSKSITAPKSAYEFEVSWRALSDDCGQQAQLLKVCILAFYVLCG